MESLRRLTSSVFDGNSRLGLGKKSAGPASPANGVSGTGSPFTTPPVSATAAHDTRGLDVTFITERLLVMGFPVLGPTNRKQNQNNIEELATFLEAHFANQYLIFNLNALEDGVGGTDSAASTPTAKEQRLRAGSGALPLASLVGKSTTQQIAEYVRDQMLEFAWERDGMKAHTPPLDLIFRICYAIFAWLSLDPNNVACIHCQSGRTRSGVVVACYLLFARLADNPTDAFVEFYQKRWEMKNLTAHYLKKKTPPSIQRFLSSFHTLIEHQRVPNEKPLLLKAIIFRALPVDHAPCVQIWDDYKMIFCSETMPMAVGSKDARDAPVIDWNADDGFLGILWENGIDLDGGFSILCSFGDDYDADENLDPSTRVLFRYADSTWFLSPGLLTLKKNDMDMMKQYEFGFEEEQFSMDLVLHDSPKPRRNYVRIDYTGNNAVRQGLIEITKHHLVLPDPAMHSNFLRMGFGETPTTFALQRSQNAPNVALDLLHSEGIVGCFPPDLRALDNSSDGTADQREQQAGEPTNTNSPLQRRQSTAEIVAMQSQRSRYSTPTTTSDTAICQVCKEDDYMMRPQLVKCMGRCGIMYHTTCVGLKKIPFGLTTLSDRTNHAVYVKKYFSAWECDKCTPAVGSPPNHMTVAAPSPTYPREYERASLTALPPNFGGSAYPINNDNDSTATPLEVSAPCPRPRAESDNPDNLEKLKEFLAVSGISVEELLRAATTPNFSISPSPAKFPADGAQHANAQLDAPPAPRAGGGYALDIASTTQIRMAGSLAGVQQHVTGNQIADATSMEVTNVNSTVVSRRIGAHSQTASLGISPAAATAQAHDDAAAAHRGVSTLVTTSEASSVPVASASSAPAAAPKIDLSAQLLKENMSVKPNTDDISSTNEESGPSLTKYNTMLQRGVPFEAVQNCMVKDGVDPSLLKPLPEIKLEEKEQAPSDAAAGLRLKDVEEFSSYFRMLRLGCQKEAVRQKLVMDGVDPIILELGPEALYEEVKHKIATGRPKSERSSLLDDIKDVKDVKKPATEQQDETKANTPNTAPTESSTPAAPPSNEQLLKDHEMYAKYFKMLRMGLPQDAVRHKMKQDGADERALELGPDAPVSRLTATETTGTRLKDDPTYAQYFKMLVMGIPEGAVRQKMAKDNVNVKALDLGPDALVSELEKLEDVKLKDHPEYSKYFNMLKVGLPMDVVKHKMTQESADVRALELGPDALYSRLKELTTGRKATKPAPVKQRRKKLHWQAIPEDRLSSINQQTIWEEKDEASVQFDMDMDELESLFFANTDKKKSQPQARSLKRKQTVTLIDGKRAMNAGILLARVKLSYSEVSTAVMTLTPNGMTLEQLMGINEFLPTPEEIATVKQYNGEKALLGEAEKFILEIANLKRFAPRMECLIFKLAYAGRANEVRSSLQNISNACEEVKGSRLLKILLGVVLKLGNTLNGSGNENEIRGFTVDSLLRLGHTKAVNQKTTVLHYLVRLIKKNHPQVLEFSDELRTVPQAARESFETIQEDFSKLQAGLKKMKDELQLLEKDAQEDSSSAAVAEGLRKTVSNIETEICNVEDASKAAKEQVASVLEYFGEDPKRNPTDFFTTLASFCSAFDGARKQVDTEDEAAQRAERMRLRRSATMARPPLKTSAAEMFANRPLERAMSDRPGELSKRHNTTEL
ncbi:TPA: hypothetical protein N0F65_000969 [Lagenidium giganteum]|uniref:Formin-like protein n=1 Tax=Lagenidium giganteum TaxID=4803 RepID=A0AAV2Z096_9STRA|nr:TPA: hypothetical protein N0F65_000969 [Lagenidium giganteum]